MTIGEPQRILLLGLGEVGDILAAELPRNTGAMLLAWDIRFAEAASAPSRHLAAHPGLAAATDAARAAEGCDLVISAVTAGQALPAAQSTLPGMAPGSWYLDLNSVSPATKESIAAAAAECEVRFVEAAVMSPIGPRRLHSPVLLAGPHAGDFLPTGHALGFSAMQLCSEQWGSAAATKICRSIVVKGMEALVSESMLTARHFGVEQAVLESLNDLFPRPDWPGFAGYMIGRALQHGTRRAEEMREAGRAVTEAGYSPWMSAATVKRQDWAARFSSAAGAGDLPAVLDAIREASLAEQARKRKP